jgi:hypothetical protein
MVTGKSRRIAGVLARSRDPRRNARRTRPPLILGALGGWLPAAKSRDVCPCPDVFSRRQGRERGLQSGAALVRQRNRLGATRLEEHPPLLRGVNSMVKPNGRLVLVSCAHHCASTPSLSTRSSSWALQGDLILGRASRLYAFSGYHNRTSLPSRALGRTTGTQEVRPSRSSRTKDSPPQISYAHSR